MIDPNYILLYVDNPVTSAGFYTELLGKSPVEFSSTFVLYVLASGVKLGLWAKDNVEPVATMIAGGGELAFSVADNDTVHRLHADWVKRGLAIAQAPTEMDFGYTFLACDPDGHRLRIFAPS